MQTRNIAGLKVNVFETPDDLGKAVAERLYNRMEQESLVLGLPTGRTPKPVYRWLGKLIEQDPVDLSDVQIFWMDDYVFERDGEYRLPDRDVDYSYRKYADEVIRGWNSSLPEPQRLEKSHFPDPRDPEEYEEKIEDTGGIDIFITAAGSTDGHVAFNPAGTGLDSRTRIVELAEQTRRDNLKTVPAFEGKLENVPTHGVSVGLGTILDSDKILFLAQTAEKKQMVERFLESEEFDPDFPVTFHWQAAEKTEAFLDQEALPDSIG